MNNIPQGYKQTELGIIPEEWEVVTVDDVLDMPTKTISTTSFFSKYYVGTENMYSLKRGIAPYRGYLPYMQVREYQPNDILTSNIRPYLKKIWLANRYGGCSSDVIVFRVKDAKTHSPAYIYTILSDDAFFKYSMDSAIGTKMPRGDKSAIKVYTFIIPKDIAEQRAIAAALSDVDGLIAALDKKIAKKRLLKQGAMQQLLTGKKRLHGFTDKWKYVALEHLLEYEQPTKYLVQSTDYIESGTPVLTAGKTFILGYTAETKGIYTNLPVIIFDDFTTDSKYVTMPFKAKSSAMKMLQLKDRRYNLRLVYELMQLIQFPLYDHQRYWISEYSKLQVYIPSDFVEQQAIATILSDMDKEIADLEAQRDKYRLLKSGMMQKLLTGQIRLVKQQAKIIPLGVEVPAVREIPIDTHIIAGHIVNRSHQSRGWGRTKLQKSLHLIGYCMQLNLGNEYIRNTAGPDDQQLMNYIDQKFRQYRHVNKVCEKLPNGKTHYSYTPTPMIQDVEMAYEKYSKELREQVDALIDKLNTMDLAGAEIISTLYAVWNNRIIKGEQITDDLLIADFYAWSTHKTNFEEARVRKALNYMRKENIIPIGWGKYIDKR